MKYFFYMGMISIMTLTGCISEYIYQNDQRYATPSALDSPLSGAYDTYQTHFLGKYRITFQSFESGCHLRALETPRLPDGSRSHFYVAPDIYEKDGKTWQGSNVGSSHKDLDPYVRSVISERKEYKDINGQTQAFEPREEGYQSLCFESWWMSSSYVSFSIRKSSVQKYVERLKGFFPEGRWSQKRLSGNTWSVQEVAEKDLREPPLNGVGGPYQNWLLPIGDTGYTIVLQLGASRETLKHPEAFEELKGVFKHLLESVKVESI